MRILAPSGRRVNISHLDDHKVSSITGTAQFFGPAMRQTFSFGRTGFAAAFGAEAVGAQGKTVDRFLYLDREMSITVAGSGRSVSFASWHGSHHDVCMMGPGTLSRVAVTQAYDQVVLTDTTEGISILPHSRSRAAGQGSTVIVMFDRSVGVVLPDVETARTMRPGSAGTRTKHGEVWRLSKVMDDPDQASRRTRDFTYFVGTTRGFAQVNFMEHYQRGDDALSAFLDNLDVSWQ